MGRKVGGRLRLVVLTGLILVTAVAQTALAAAGNQIHITAPRHARARVHYSIKLRGRAARSEVLFMFNDIYRCGRSPHVEYYGHKANGDYWDVKGRFRESSRGWTSKVPGKYHVCTYLTWKSAGRIPSSGIIARKFKTFRVRSA